MGLSRRAKVASDVMVVAAILVGASGCVRLESDALLGKVALLDENPIA